MEPDDGQLLSGLSEEEILGRILPLLDPTRYAAGTGPDPGVVAGGRTVVGRASRTAIDPSPAVGFGPSATSVTIVGPGDDAAVVAVSEPLVVTTDSMIRGRDWRDDWSSPTDVAIKLGAQNISDIAAMGGVAAGAVLTLTADPQTPMQWVETFAAGLGQWCADAGVSVVGGDLSSAPAGVLHVSLTMWGSLQGRAPVLRSGARPGDVVAVCGSLGWSDAGLTSYAAGDPSVELGPDSAEGDRAREAWRWYHRCPRPPWEAGPVAADAGATSMIDISDGLVRDAGRVAAASGVRIDLDRGRLNHFVEDFLVGGVEEERAWRHVLGGGEEHSMLATFPDEASVPQTPDSPWRVIGQVRSGTGVTLDDETLHVLGWDHFRT